jgi:hypothetical protein
MPARRNVQVTNDAHIGVSSCSKPGQNILALLEGGDRRSIGLSLQVASIVSTHRALFPELMKRWWFEDPLV